MGFWDKVKELFGLGACDASGKDDPNAIENRILNADRHHFRVDDPEPQTAEQ